MSNEVTPCTLTLPDGSHYDLSSLSNAKKDYSVKVGDLDYNLNVCRDVVHELWNVGEVESVGAVVTHSKGDFSLGATNSTLVASPGTFEPMLVYSGGSQCVDSDNTASTVIRFICSESEFGSGSPQLIAGLPVTSNPEDQCQFFFEWKTHVACPTNPKQLQGHWTAIGLLLVFLMIGAFTTFAGITMYNRFVLGLKGWDQLPRPTLPHLHWSGLRGLFRRDAPSGPGWGSWNRSGGYGHVRAEDNDEEEGFAGRFSLADDDDDEDARALSGDPAVWRNAEPAKQGHSNVNGGGRGLVNL
ncbi:hypothetical protein NCC49_003624 [Naganishia albida]|nr:hypothetical protein NCC49_003624 [Naganishia albida]